MPIETSLPFPNPQPNMRVGWPDNSVATANPGAFVISGFADGFAHPNVWGASTGAGANQMRFRNGIICAQFDDVVFRGCTASLPLQVRDENLAPGYIGAEFARVYRLTVALSIDGAADRGTCLQFGPTTGLTGRFTQGGQAAFGVCGDGAGGWEYLQSDDGAFPGNITDSVLIGVAVVPDATDWNTFVFEIINSAPGRDASFTLNVNGVLVVSRNWVAPLALPDYSELAVSNKFVWATRANDVGVDLFVGPWTVEMGRFTAAGLEILS